MGIFCPVTVLGGLPVIAEVWFSGPDYYGEYDCGCDALYWEKRDGSCGAPLSERMMKRVEAFDEYWEADVTEAANDWLSVSTPRRYPDGTEEGEYCPQYFLLNPRKPLPCTATRPTAEATTATDDAAPSVANPTGAE